MATNQMVSQMPNLGGAAADDLLYIVDNASKTSCNITVGQLVGSLPDTRFSGSIQTCDAESVITGGTIPDAKSTYAIVVDTADVHFSLAVGTTTSPLPLFQIKILYLKATNGGRAVIDTGLASPITSVVLSEPTNSAVFMSTPTGWILLSGVAEINYQD